MTTETVVLLPSTTVEVIKNRGAVRLSTGGQGPRGGTGATGPAGNVDSPDSSVTDLIALSQAEYDLLTPDATTVYFITS